MQYKHDINETFLMALVLVAAIIGLPIAVGKMMFVHIFWFFALLFITYKLKK